MVQGFNVLFQEDNFESPEVDVYFSNIEAILLKKIEQYDAVVGCVAWLSNVGLLQALASRPSGSCIIMEKKAKTCLSPSGISIVKAANALPFPVSESAFAATLLFSPDLVDHNAVNNDFLRLFGGTTPGTITNKNPLLHHKFIVCCDIKEGEPIPKEVVTGSYNYSDNANYSRENIVVLRNAKAVRSYYNEWLKCFLLSEAFDSTYTNMTPQHLSASEFARFSDWVKQQEEYLDAMIEKEREKDDFGRL